MPAEDHQPDSSRPCAVLPPPVYGGTDACALAAAYREGSEDPVTVAERCIEAALARETVYLEVSAGRARKEALAAQARIREGRPKSFFDGVPLNWKDTFDVAGTVTTAGSAIFRHDPPKGADGALAHAASLAGMVCVGKTNTCEFAYSSVGINRHFGSPENPCSPPGDARVCGGSSSGSAASVAAGIIPVSMGSDAGGSIRIPAAFSGICGFKPTSGRYSREGMRALAKTLDAPGPMAKSVRDLVVMDRILRGEPVQHAPVAQKPQGQRFVVDMSVFEDGTVADDVFRVFKEAVSRLEEAGAVVERRVVRSFHEARQSMARGWIMGAEVFEAYRALLDDPEMSLRMDQRVRKRAEASRNMPPGVIAASFRDRERLTATMRDDLAGAVFILPGVAHTAPALEPLVTDDERFAFYVQANPRLTAFANFLDMPGVALPAGAGADGLPVGVCLYHETGADAALLEAALAAEAATGGGR